MNWIQFIMTIHHVQSFSRKLLCGKELASISPKKFLSGNHITHSLKQYAQLTLY